MSVEKRLKLKVKMNIFKILHIRKLKNVDQYIKLKIVTDFHLNYHYTMEAYVPF